MSTLLVDELYDGINFDQAIRIKRDVNLAHIRPWVYVQGTLVDGDFTVEILDGDATIFTASIPYTQINAMKTETFAHGFIRFDFESLALHVEEGSNVKEYTLRFSMQNHTTDTNNFLGIVRQWEDKIYDLYGNNVLNNEAPNDTIEPAGLEFYDYDKN